MAGESVALLQNLVSFVASKPEGTQAEEEVESRFRALLPVLLTEFFVPDEVQEGEIRAISRLINHIVKTYPRVLVSGKAHGVLPVLSRIIPLFAEPTTCYDALFETLPPLVRLLHDGDVEVFRKFFVDITLLLEDLVSVGSFLSAPTRLALSSTLTVQCFQNAFSSLSADSQATRLIEPSRWEASDAPGLFIDVSGTSRWLPFTLYVMKLITRLLPLKSLHVQGLVTFPFMFSVGGLISHSSSAVRMACFDLFRAAASALDRDVLPWEKVILSTFSSLSLVNGERPSFRDKLFDDSIGACLISLFSACSLSVLERTAGAFVKIFSVSIRTATSTPLKIALCKVMAIILRKCPSYSSTFVMKFLGLIFIPDIVAAFSRCLHLALDALRFDDVLGSSTSVRLHKSAKRRKLHGEDVLPFRCLHEVIAFLGTNRRTNPMPDECFLAGFCVLVRAVRKSFYHQLVKHFCSWLMKFKGQSKQITVLQVSLLLELVDGLFFNSAFEVPDGVSTEVADVIIRILELPWTSDTGTMQGDYPQKAKLFVLKILAKMKDPCQFDAYGLLERGLTDDDAHIRSASVTSIVSLIKNSDVSCMVRLCELLRGIDENVEEVQRVLAAKIGSLFCIYSSKLLSTSDVQNQETGEFICAFCHSGGLTLKNITEQSSSFYAYWKPTVEKFLLRNDSALVKAAMIRSLSRIFAHSSKDELGMSSDIWKQCLEEFPVHPDRSVRTAFRSQIKYFIEERIWNCSSVDVEKGSDYEVLSKLRHALVVVKIPEMLQSLMETIADIVKFAKCHLIRVYALVLLVEQLDNQDLCTRVMSIKFIHEVAAVQWTSDSNKRLERMAESLRKGLFEYLSGRLVSRPSIIKAFAEAVVKTQMSDLLTQMVPVVFPKLILEQEHDERASRTLNAFADQLETSLQTLLLDWCHKVFSVLLLLADGNELRAALSYYERHTGYDPYQLFSAVMPPLLDELVQFLGDNSSTEAIRRSTRVRPMVQVVATIVSGSDDLPKFMKEHFTRLLDNIDRNHLRSNNVALQKKALRCIEPLLDMIDYQLGAFVPKVMIVLSQALEQGLRHESLKVWRTFVRKLSPSSLQEFAGQIVVILMPCLESEQSSVVEAAVGVLEELIVMNKDALGDRAKELPVLPSLPSLAAVNAVLNGARGSFSLRDELLRAADGLGHESLSLRHVTATELFKVLSSRRNDVSAMIHGEESSDAGAFSDVVTVLLRGCAEKSQTPLGQRFKLACAECLGALGAIDPVKLDIDLRHYSMMEQSDEDIVYQLINVHLAKIVRAATDTLLHDAAALAIQELLKLTGCQEEGARTSKKKKRKSKNPLHFGDQLWNRFPKHVKEIIAPYLTSTYFLRGTPTPVPVGPIFRPGISFNKWMYQWCRRLLTQARGPRLDIFTACQGVTRHDMNTAIYLLPYLILDVACYSDEESSSAIKDEILSVLSDAGCGSDFGQSTVGKQPVYVNNVSCWSDGEVCTQTVFLLLDSLGQWANLTRPSGGKGKDNESSLEQCNRIFGLLNGIPKKSLALASFRCGAYARALLYYESYVREKSGAFNPAGTGSGRFEDDDISFLLKIYAGLDEPDGLSGLAHLQKRPSLQDRVLINKKSGNWAEALTSCEQALELEPKSIYWHSGVLDCLVNMGHLQGMVTHVDGLLARLPDSKKEWSMRGVQAAWRLGQWDLMKEYVRGSEQGPRICATENDSSFDLSLARILQAMRKRNAAKFQKQLLDSRMELLAPLAAASMESYVRAYPLILKLHMLREVEEFFALPEGDEDAVSSLVDVWNVRLKLTMPSLSTREPILALRRLLFSARNMQSEMAVSWLQFAKLCRTSGHFEIANRAILQAQALGAPNAHIEKAKLLWDTKKSDRAIEELQQALVNNSRNLGKACDAALGGVLVKPTQLNVDVGDQMDTAKTLLLLGRWAHHTGQKQKEDVISIFTRVRDMQPMWGKGYFYLAKYYDDLLVDAKKRQEDGQEGTLTLIIRRPEDKPWWSYLPDTLLYYGKALHKGHHHLYQALPRLLTLWFEFGSTYFSDADEVNSNRLLKSAYMKVMSILRGCLKDLPTYQWLATFPQLVSRICHDNTDVVVIVKSIIQSVLRAYPQQALWMLAAVSKSEVQERREAASEIITAAKAACCNDAERGIFVQFTAFVDQMIRLCCATTPNPKARSLVLSANEFSTLKRMMPLNIILPVQRALTVNLPAHGQTTSRYSPFPSGHCTTIVGIHDEVEILASLQQPKKVIFIGSDGHEHPFLCKPKDDLRKDARMMEFTGMINRLLSKDPASRRRKLYIRTFSVVPLAEDCGMVEWVLHTKALRHILQGMYMKSGVLKKNTLQTVKDMYDASEGKKSGAELMSKVLPIFPPIYHKWFQDTFPEPTAWFRAKLAYARTTAVWSMVGHIVGLGDRHAENILFDSTTGDCVHVDFSCLFDKGLLLDKPELVPFRLTQNMVDGLGITGYQGVFLRACEITLSVLRAHRETLVSVLETFIHDPLVEWTKFHKSSATEVRNPHAQRAIANIQARLQGVVVGVAASPSLPLSVEGQAQRLILEAVNHENLGQMYVWWMPWF